MSVTQARQEEASILSKWLLADGAE